MANKSQQLQIRVTPQQKSALKRRAARAGQDLSTYVLSRVLPEVRETFEARLRDLRVDSQRRYALAALGDFLRGLTPAEFSQAVCQVDLTHLSGFLKNYVAAMVEQAATLKGVSPPEWTATVEGLDEPYFAAPLLSLRPHLLRSAPVPFKRRNLFVDATLEDRV